MFSFIFTILFFFFWPLLTHRPSQYYYQSPLSWGLPYAPHPLQKKKYTKTFMKREGGRSLDQSIRITRHHTTSSTARDLPSRGAIASTPRRIPHPSHAHSPYLFNSLFTRYQETPPPPVLPPSQATKKPVKSSLGRPKYTVENPIGRCIARASVGHGFAQG